MIAPRNAGEKPKENISGILGKLIVSQHSTVKFTEALETPLRVQNFGGNFQKGIIGRISQCGQLKRYIRRLLNNNILLKGF